MSQTPDQQPDLAAQAAWDQQMRDAAKLPWYIAWPTNIAIGLLVFAMVAMVAGGIALAIGVFKLFG